MDLIVHRQYHSSHPAPLLSPTSSTLSARKINVSPCNHQHKLAILRSCLPIHQIIRDSTKRNTSCFYEYRVGQRIHCQFTLEARESWKKHCTCSSRLTSATCEGWQEHTSNSAFTQRIKNVICKHIGRLPLLFYRAVNYTPSAYSIFSTILGHDSLELLPPHIPTPN
jgi:hypothetical protein